jgi:signal transduction histidine kinase
VKRSIRVRLLVCVFGLLLPLSAAAGWLSVQLFGNRLMHDIDVSLQEEAETIAELATVSSGPDAVARVLPHIAGDRDFGTKKYITVSRDGRLLVESPPGAQGVLRSAAPDLRVVRYESDESARPVTVTIAVSAAAATHAQRRLRSPLTIGGPLLALLFGTGLWLVIGRTLRPLENAARQLDGVGADTLAVRVQTTNPDDEVGRMVTVVNRMLDRLERAVAELRRLTADAAHELCTPLTVLRAGLEVALARERPAAEYRAALSDALASTSRLCRLAEDLLTLARLESAAEPRGRVPVDLSEMLRELGEAWADICFSGRPPRRHGCSTRVRARRGPEQLPTVPRRLLRRGR